MSDPFLGEIRLFPFDYAPTGWALCAGQLLPISQNTALFSLLGITYGGDGRVTFALPNLAGSVPVMPGQGPGLSAYGLGETGGVPSVTLSAAQMPAHNHLLQADALDPADLNAPAPSRVLAQSSGVFAYQRGGPNAALAAQALGAVGEGAAHSNLMPTLVLNFCIALQGIFPQRP